MFSLIRPHSIDLAVLVHVAGAMVLVGGVTTTAAVALIGCRGEGGLPLLRFSAKTLFAVALPGWIVMRVAAEWAASKEHLNDLPSDPTWLGMGFGIADGSGVVLLVALILGGIGLRRSRDGRSGGNLLKISGALAGILIIAYIVAVWAMGAKPS